MATNNRKKVMSEKDIQKELKILKASYEMYERTKNDTEEKRKKAKDKSGNLVYSEDSTEETLSLIESSQKDILDKYVSLGGDPDELKKETSKTTKKKDRGVIRDNLFAIMKQEMENELKNGENKVDDAVPFVMTPSIANDNDDDYTTYAEEEKKKKDNVEAVVDKKLEIDYHPETVKKEKKTIESKKGSKKAKNSEDTTDEKEIFGISSINIDVSNATGKNIKYDVIPIPSKGRCYQNKIGKIPVAYLTAYDENMIMSPNLYQDGSFLDYILKAKIMTSQVNAGDLIVGDREAILVWLRASSYGPMYPISVHDPESNTDFNYLFDLRELKYKKFDLQSDEYGYFDYTMPVTGDKIKFKFLSYDDLKRLNEITISEDALLRKDKIINICATLKTFIEDDLKLGRDEKKKYLTNIDNLVQYGDTIITETEEKTWNHLVTNRLIEAIISVNGVTDKKYIEEYVTYMNVKDASAFRKYMQNNEPGLDLNISVPRPESLGGGSIPMFLSFDQFIFLNVAQTTGGDN